MGHHARTHLTAQMDMPTTALRLRSRCSAPSSPDAVSAHGEGEAFAVHAPLQAPQFGVDARDAVRSAGREVGHGDLVGRRLVPAVLTRNQPRKGALPSRRKPGNSPDYSS